VRLLTDILDVEAALQVAAKVAEEYLPVGKELTQALRILLFERAKEMSIQEQEEKEGKHKKSTYRCC